MTLTLKPPPVAAAELRVRELGARLYRTPPRGAPAQCGHVHAPHAQRQQRQAVRAFQAVVRRRAPAAPPARRRRRQPSSARQPRAHHTSASTSAGVHLPCVSRI
ncbi:hypothetical protein EON68_00170 [archaeon]|nr:MAG: hypothetical protein EON68_00170 [archaeon]